MQTVSRDITVFSWNLTTKLRNIALCKAKDSITGSKLTFAKSPWINLRMWILNVYKPKMSDTSQYRQRSWNKCEHFSFNLKWRICLTKTDELCHRRAFKRWTKRTSQDKTRVSTDITFQTSKTNNYRISDIVAASSLPLNQSCWIISIFSDFSLKRQLTWKKSLDLSLTMKIFFCTWPFRGLWRGLMSSRRGLHVRYRPLCMSQLPSAKHQREIAKFLVLRRKWTRALYSPRFYSGSLTKKVSPLFR